METNKELRFLLPSRNGETTWTCSEHFVRDWGLLQSLKDQFGDGFLNQEIPLFNESCADSDVMNRIVEYTRIRSANVADASGSERDSTNAVQARRELVRDWEWDFFGDVRKTDLVQARDICRSVQRIADAAMFLNYVELSESCERFCAAVVRCSAELACLEMPEPENVIAYLLELADDFDDQEREEVLRDKLAMSM